MTLNTIFKNTTNNNLKAIYLHAAILSRVLQSFRIKAVSDAKVNTKFYRNLKFLNLTDLVIIVT